LMRYVVVRVLSALVLLSCGGNGVVDRYSALNLSQVGGLSDALALVYLCHYAESMIADAA